MKNDGKGILSQLKSYVNKLDEFQGALKGGVDTRFGAIKEKVLDVAIPPGANKQQIEMINKAVDYAKSLNIKLNIRVIK